MTPYEKEVLYTMRNAEGAITHVFDPKLNKYLIVVDTSITINPSDSDNEGDKTNKFARFVQESKNDI